MESRTRPTTMWSTSWREEFAAQFSWTCETDDLDCTRPLCVSMVIHWNDAIWLCASKQWSSQKKAPSLAANSFGSAL